MLMRFHMLSPLLCLLKPLTGVAVPCTLQISPGGLRNLKLGMGGFVDVVGVGVGAEKSLISSYLIIKMTKMTEESSCSQLINRYRLCVSTTTTP